MRRILRSPFACGGELKSQAFTLSISTLFNNDLCDKNQKCVFASTRTAIQPNKKKNINYNQFIMKFYKQRRFVSIFQLKQESSKEVKRRKEIRSL